MKAEIAPPSSRRRALLTTILASLILVSLAAVSDAKPSRPKEPPVITFDFGSGRVTCRECEKGVKDGAMVRFEVENVNTFLYDVGVNGVPVTRFTEFSGLAAKTILAAKVTALGEAGQEADTKNLLGLQLDLPRHEAALLALEALPDELESIVYNADLRPSQIRHEIRRAILRLPSYAISGTVHESDLAAYAAGLLDNLGYRDKDPEADLGWKRRWASADLAKCKALRTSHAGLPAKAEAALAIVEAARRQTFKVSSLPMQATGDALKFSIEIRRREGVPAKYPTPLVTVKTDLIEVPVVGGFKVDCSAGVFFTNLVPKNFYVATDKTIGVLAPGDKYTPGAGLLLIHAYARSGTSANLSLFTFGVGMSDSKLTNYLVGVSLLFGRKQRLNVTYGLVGGYVKELGGGYKKGDAFAGDSSQLPLVDHFRFGQFVALTVNL
ncbi:MAG: hypothetical protein AAB152_16350 [Candidatus Coatesbacteria bacterium]